MSEKEKLCEKIRKAQIIIALEGDCYGISCSACPFEGSLDCSDVNILHKAKEYIAKYKNKED